MADLNKYTDAVLYLLYTHYMDSRFDTTANFTDFDEPATLEYLNFVEKLAVRHKKNRCLNWTPLIIKN